VNPNFSKVIVQTLLLPGLVCLVLAGCTKTRPSAAEVRVRWTEKTNQTITDPARAQQIAVMVGRLLDAQEAKAAALQSASDRLAALNSDHHATSEQAMAIYEECEARQREMLTKFRDDVLALRRQLSAAEWQSLVD
jgi:predicted component of type VI protein secretion system